MSLIQKVVAIVKERGQASADQIHVEGKTHQQIINAMQNAAYVGLLVSVQTRGKQGQRAGRLPNVYKATNAEPRKRGPRERGEPKRPPRGKYGHMGRVSSVFDLGQSAGLGA